ncbi:MAG: hypothetical protein M1834_007649 [Cirrosporium novae-zelandiae]|nr:MAG: hypothetical protein M1834_007649 [Cirrosporium novae-zelandiae]
MPKIPRDVWEEKKPEIIRLYQQEGYPLKLLMRTLQSEEFNPNESQLRSRLKRWKITKIRNDPKSPTDHSTQPQAESPAADSISPHDQEYSSPETTPSPQDSRHDALAYSESRLRHMPATSGMTLEQSQAARSGHRGGLTHSYEASPVSPLNFAPQSMWGRADYQGSLPPSSQGVIGMAMAEPTSTLSPPGFASQVPTSGYFVTNDQTATISTTAAAGSAGLHPQTMQGPYQFQYQNFQYGNPSNNSLSQQPQGYDQWKGGYLP